MSTINIFNSSLELKDYQNTPLLFGKPPGMFDTIHKRHPQIWDLYKEMKSLDWSEDEVDFSPCNLEFKTCPKPVSDMMIKTLAWQWEADSIASRSIAPLLAPFISSSELWAAWLRVSDNEVLHATTYSEIVRLSFDDGAAALAGILEDLEARKRMKVVAEVFSELYLVSHQYALDRVFTQERYNTVYLAICTLLMLERVQFILSFAVTFTIADSGLFQPIGQIVKKIAQDELEVHVELDKAVLSVERKTEYGKIAMEQTLPRLQSVLDEVIAAEQRFISYLHQDGNALLGATEDSFRNFLLFNCRDVAKFLDLDTSKYRMPRSNPMPHLDKWLNMNKQQSASQEINNVAYKVGVVVDDSAGKVFDADF